MVGNTFIAVPVGVSDVVRRKVRGMCRKKYFRPVLPHPPCDPFLAPCDDTQAMRSARSSGPSQNCWRTTGNIFWDAQARACQFSLWQDFFKTAKTDFLHVRLTPLKHVFCRRYETTLRRPRHAKLLCALRVVCFPGPQSTSAAFVTRFEKVVCTKKGDGAR